MGKKRFVQYSVATSAAATRGAATQATTMIEAAMTATLPAVGQSVNRDKISDRFCMKSKSDRLASAQSS